MVKPPPDRLYGRQRSHKLRPRQQRLLDVCLPRLRYAGDDPFAAFAARPARIWLEVGFGGGEHALAQARENPDTGLIACEVFEQGICSLLAGLVAKAAAALGAAAARSCRICLLGWWTRRMPSLLSFNTH